MKKKFKFNLKLKLPKTYQIMDLMAVFLVIALVSIISIRSMNFQRQANEVIATKTEVENILSQTKKELEELKNQDQIVRNDNLEQEIEDINKTYQSAVVSYEKLLLLKEKTGDTEKLDELFTDALVDLSNKKYEGASNILSDLNTKITEAEAEIASKLAQESPPANVPQSNAPPGTGYSRQTVNTDSGSFVVSIIAADYGSTRVIVDTATNGDCANDCPVLSLSEYVSRNNAFAGVNGSYFCPATYPSCAGKTNSFDLLVMNKDKTYVNSDNNVYSNNPGVIFGGGYIRFVTSVSQWGRDTGIDSMLSNFPMLVFNGGITFGGDDDPKKGSKGNRSFVGNKGNTIYIGVVHNATVAESARAMAALGMENALNLDDGGSTALWYGGYKLGPGRNLPNAILFVRK